MNETAQIKDGIYLLRCSQSLPFPDDITTKLSNFETITKPNYPLKNTLRTELKLNDDEFKTLESEIASLKALIEKVRRLLESASIIGNIPNLLHPGQ